MEKITQEDLTAVRSFIHVFRAAGKMEAVLQALVSADEQIAAADVLYSKATKRAQEAEAAAIAKESEFASKLNSLEAELSNAKRRNAEEMDKLNADLASAEQSKDEEFAKFLNDLKGRQKIAEKLHASTLSDLDKIEAAKKAEIEALSVVVKDLQQGISRLEARKAELQEEFRALLRK